MRKILFFGLAFLFFNSVLAMDTKTFYSDYGEYINGYKDTSDLVEINSYNKYKYYNFSSY